MSAAVRWGWSRRRGNGRRGRTRRENAPALTPLEPRVLAAVNGTATKINVIPQIIPNLPRGPQVEVRVVGLLATTSPAAPVGLYFVTDEYGADEPTGHMPLIPLGPNAFQQYEYAFNFTVGLQAKRSTNTPDGRHYDLFVGGTDKDGTAGQTVEVLVPKTFTKAHGPRPAALPRHRG